MAVIQKLGLLRFPATRSLGLPPAATRWPWYLANNVKAQLSEPDQTNSLWMEFAALERCGVDM